MRPAPDWNVLQGEISGEVVLPGSPHYEKARGPAILRFHNVRPQAVVLCETPADVSETILFARRSGLRTAIRSGGHCFAGRSSSEGIVIGISPMHSVSVSAGVATVDAGARLGEVYDALDEHGLTIPAGCGPSVGISGLTLRLSSGEIGHEKSRPVSRDGPALTGRQLEVLQLLAEGKSTRDISAGLYLSQATVRNHIRALLQGLGAQGSRPWPERGSSGFWSGSLARIRPF